MTVKLVEEIEHPSERARLLLHSVEELQPAREEPRPPKPPAHHREHLIELMGTIARILGIRMQLFCAFLGAAGLGGYAVYKADVMSLVGFGLYAAMVFLPVLWVCHRRG